MKIYRSVGTFRPDTRLRPSACTRLRYPRRHASRTGETPSWRDSGPPTDRLGRRELLRLAPPTASSPVLAALPVPGVALYRLHTLSLKPPRTPRTQGEKRVMAERGKHPARTGARHNFAATISSTVFCAHFGLAGANNPGWHVDPALYLGNTTEEQRAYASPRRKAGCLPREEHLEPPGG